MTDKIINNVVIVGGGTAGWISAALLVRMLGKTLNVTLVESDQIGTVGVGEATIPPILTLNQALGIDQADFMAKTNATIKLGIEFENWRKPGHKYMHAFGKLGKDFPFCGFEQLWLRGLKAGYSSDFWDYSLNYQAAKQGKFALLDNIPKTDMQGLVYAFHFDAGLYANYLRELSERAGVTRIEGKVKQVDRHTASGDITSLVLDDGRTVDGDLFIDCSGFRALLIGETLGVEYEDWRHWLPCDSALAVQSEASLPVPPYTQSIAHSAGWRWRIPLTKRTGNGIVFSSQHMHEEEARQYLLDSLDGAAITEPRLLRFTAGRRASQWHKNCVAIGLSSGFLEPLESTSIHLIQTAVIRLLKLFPHAGIKATEVAEYNRQAAEEIEHVRDFIILHYHATEREDSEFWRACRSMDIPDGLRHKIELFRQSGKVYNPTEALFSDVAWQQVMLGQGIVPNDYHPLADAMSEAQLAEYHRNVKSIIKQVVEKLPLHQDFLDVVHRKS
ncbi:tryptophan halogenase family protein [Arenicella xantha]|uniref:Tryptophan halogenase n=1 Tax=Arenicella xantha TaxID=644221 RepID=A0A395JL93_9GAMM|nr:tryptophan halogenase family protein [Arenicella xantha]RBP49738.1 tryptophan halogenase [Arenicella xantha]